MYSKSQIDRFGKWLIRPEGIPEDKLLDAEIALDEWRQEFLQPLTDVTLKCQELLQNEIPNIYIAQRLKRKPQIINKLNRAYPMRLSQMQDIGGCRIIVEENEQIDKALELIQSKAKNRTFKVLRVADYREKGRKESGYRAVHVIANRSNHEVEIQLRTFSQHSWAEEIERTSIICEKPLKEGKGPPEVIDYFHKTSDAIHAYSRGRPITKDLLSSIQNGYKNLANVVGTKRQHLLDGFIVNERFIKSMEEKEKSHLRRKSVKNWLLIFNWNKGTFELWKDVVPNPAEAAKQYSDFEKNKPFADGYEVVLIGARQVSTIKTTHSHYFGVNSFDEYLSEIGIKVATQEEKEKGRLSPDTRKVLEKLWRKEYWGKAKRVSNETLKNHYCQDVRDISMAIEELRRLDFLFQPTRKGPYSLNLDMKAEIDRLLKTE